MNTNKTKLQQRSFADATKRQINFKLTRCEFLTLHAVLSVESCKSSPEYDMYEKLLHHIIIGISKKFLYEGMEIKDSYIIGLTPVECIAFWLYWTDHSYSISTLTGKVLERMNEIILQLFASNPSVN